MELKVNLPFSMWNYRISGVYKIVFSDGSFYIGCSEHLRSRSSAWENLIKRGDVEPSEHLGAKITDKIREKKPATLEIVELCAPIDLKDREAFYLDKYKEDPKMVSDSDAGSWKTVLQYKVDGLFIKKHFSISGAAKYNGFRLSAVQKVLYGERNSHAGMVFIFEHDYHQRRNNIMKEHANRFKYEPKNGRKILKLDLEGNIIAEFKTQREAAKSVSLSPSSIRDSLCGKLKTAGGFKWKYSEDTTPRLL